MKQIKPQDIPTYHIDTQAPLGIELNYLDMENEYDRLTIHSQRNRVHRDDYYMFLFMETVDIRLIVDFEEIELSGTANVVMYTRPGQVHFATSIRETKGWFLMINAMLVEKNYKNTFERQFLTQRPILLDQSAMIKMQATAHLLHSIIQATPTTFSHGIICNLANVFIGIIAEQYAGSQETLQQSISRPAWIAHQFKELLSENFKTLKSPTQYAQLLNYSLSHLNESVKQVTGFPVSYWIRQQVILEAKRLLYYTDLDIREIAFLLGYEDHAYFSRLFSKVVGIPAGAFRRKFHE